MAQDGVIEHKPVEMENKGDKGRDGRDKLGRFAPGSVHNPNGCRGARRLMPLIRQVLDRPNDDDPSKTNAQRVAEVLIERILAGNTELAKEILNRMDGKIADHVIQEVIEGWQYRVEGADASLKVSQINGRDRAALPAPTEPDMT